MVERRRRAAPAGILGRRGFLKGMAVAGLAPAACGRTRTLSIYNWGDYLAREVVDGFVAAERERGTKLEIVEDFYLSEAEMTAKLRAKARYDVAIPIDYLLDTLVRDGAMHTLDLAKLPGVQHLAPEFPPWRGKDDRVYAIPYLWGTTGIGYDSDHVETPTSWNALFDPRYAGRISVIDSKGDVMDQALLAAGMDINSNDKQRIKDEIWPRLLEQKDILRAYDSNPARALVAGETWIAQIDSGDLLRARTQKPSLRYVIPREGAALWTDYLAIPVAALEPEIALRFLEHLLDPAVAAQNVNVLHYGTPNATALANGLVQDAGDPQIYPAPELRKKLQVSENWLGGTGELVDEIWLDLRGA